MLPRITLKAYIGRRVEADIVTGLEALDTGTQREVMV